MRLLEPGTKIDRFEILGHLGGGMGVVYQARDLGLERLVAIKFYSPPPTSSSNEHQSDGLDGDLTKGKERFRQEAVLLAKMAHENIVQVYEPGEYNGVPYMVMEYVEGVTLERVITEARHNLRSVSPEQKLNWMHALCSAAGHAHEKGVIHRDIKPANLILHAKKGLHLVDFGISRDMSRLVTRKEIAGTTGYMAPEQLKGDEVDQRSDVFAIGTVFYELLTYQPAFKTEWAAIEQDPVPLRDLDPSFDARIVKIVERALQKRPANRFQNGTEMAEAISKARESGRSSTPTKPDNRQRSRDRAARARRLFIAGEIEAAAVACGEALLLDPQNAEAVALQAELRKISEIEQDTPPPAPSSDTWLQRMLVSLQGVWTSVTRVAREQSATVSSVTGRGIAWVNQTISKGVKELRAWHWPRLNRQKGERLDVGPLDKRIVLVGVGTLTLASIALVSYLAWRPAPPGGIEPASSPTVSVTIDATPWAIVKEIRGEDGRVWPFESDGSTPLVLELPPGRYVVSVMGPGDQQRTVEMTVGADNNDPVRIPFDSGINVYDYFDQYLRPFEDPATGAVRTTPPPLPPK